MSTYILNQKRHSEGEYLDLIVDGKRYEVVQDGKRYKAHAQPYDYIKRLIITECDYKESMTIDTRGNQVNNGSNNHAWTANNSTSGTWTAPYTGTYEIALRGGGSKGEEKTFTKFFKKGERVSFTVGNAAYESCHTDH